MLQGTLPLYIQVKDDIEKKVLNNLKPHDKIISENALMEKYRVSRTTIRKAMGRLEQEGLVYKKQGVGSFVSEEKIHQKLANFASFSKQMKIMGYSVKYCTLKKEIIKSDLDISNKLYTSVNEKIFTLQRKAYRNKEVINLTKSYIPYRYVEGIEKYDFNENSLYEILDKNYGLKIEQTTRGITSILANYDIAEILEIKEGNPLLEFEGFVYVSCKFSEHLLLEYFKTYYRTDDTKFYIVQNAY